MAELPYSFHLGSNKNRKSSARSNARNNVSGSSSLANNGIQNARQLSKVNNHDFRKYDDDTRGIYTLKGCNDIVHDVKEFYKTEFEDARLEYNNKQSRPSRMINDYFEHVSNDEKKDLACEIIIELGNKEFWDEKNLDEWLGKPKFVYNKVDVMPQIGVVTGLAYTQYGGDTLPVEVTYYKGSGHIVLTGKLGDVMKESAQAALSYVKSNAKKFGIDEELFINNDVHIHVPEGAVPKDGPSAGITMAVGIISAFSHRHVNNKVGMTGEITLRGRILPIGGLREKSIAAHRSGLQKILIPKENLRDVDEIPECVRNELEILPMETVEDVVKVALMDE